MDPIATLLAAARAAVVFALLFAIPGLTLGPIVVPGASTPLTRLGRAVGVSLVVTALACTALARLGVLRPTILIALLVGLTLLPLHSRLPRRPSRPSGRNLRWWLGAVAGVLVAVALAILPPRLETGATLLPSGPTAWIDAALAWSTAATGTFGADLAAWGAVGPLPVPHGPVVAHAAAAFVLWPADALLQLEGYRLAILVSGILLGTLLFRRWVSTWLALMGAILLFRTVRIGDAAAGFGPVAWALVVGLFALWLTDRAIVERSRRLAAGAAVSAALVLLAHAEVFVVVAAGIVGIAVARALVRPGGGPESAGGLGHRHGRRVGLRAPIGRDVGRALGVGAVVVVAALLGGLIGDLVLTGDGRVLGLVPAADGDEPVPTLTADELPAGWSPSGDATWDFHVAATDPSQFGQPPPASFVDDRLLGPAVTHVWPWLDARNVLAFVLIAALLAIPIGGWPFADARRQRAILAWTAFTAVLLAASYAVYSLTPSYVMRRTGPTDLVPFVTIAPVVATIMGLWWLDRIVGLRLRARMWPGAMLMAGAVLTFVTAAVVLPMPAPGEDAGERRPVLSATGYETYRWMGSNLPEGTRVLANAWTDGAFGALSGHAGIVDGPAAYFAGPNGLARATGLLLGGRRTFGDPSGPGAAAFLEREGVQFLLVVTPQGSGDDLAGYAPFETDLAALQASPRYQLEQTFGDGRLLLFRVVAPSG